MVNVENIVDSAPVAAKPTRNYQRELEKLAKTAKSSPAISDIEMALATSNPVAALPFDEFVSLLRLAIQSHEFSTGSTSTRTSIEMRLGLSMLTSGKFDRPMYEPFNWAASIELLGPFLAFIYQRMHAEVRMLNTVDLPQM